MGDIKQFPPTSVDPIEALKAKFAIERAADDAVLHRMIGIIEHFVMYVTSDDGSEPPPVIEEERVN